MDGAVRPPIAPAEPVFRFRAAIRGWWKAKSLPADEVFLDLEDAVAPDAKAAARALVGTALAGPGWAGQLRGVRINDWTTEWTYTDVIEVVSAAGAHLDVIVLPKVTDASHVHALDLLLTQLERSHGLPVGRIGIDAQIEDAGARQHQRHRRGAARSGVGAGAGRSDGQPQHAHPGGGRATGGL